jgi:Fur family zinc uptake transcriptional regulator
VREESVLKVEDIVSKMAAQGLRITEQRKSLARLFVEHNGYLTPKHVYEHMGKIYPGLSFDTVYRNLRVLHDLGILEQFVFEDGIKFRVHCQEAGGHHHHFICLECEKTVPITFCPMDSLTDVPPNVQVVRHKFEVYGYCESCERSDPD